jgi:hypothetical protein
MHSIFLMNIPRQFADLNSRVFLKVNQVVDQDASAIVAGFCQMQDKIIHLFANLAYIRPAGQVDVLPFPCEQNPTLIHLLFQGDKLLSSRLQADCDYSYQYLSIVHGVVFQAKDILCHGNNHGGTQVIHSPCFQRNLQQAQQHPQVPYYAPQQQQQAHVHFALQPPPPPPPQQQQQQPPQQQQQQQQPLQQQPPQQQPPQQQPQQQQQQQVPFAPQPPLPPQQQRQHVANGLYAAEIQHRARAAARAQQQNPGGSNRS